jgi:hypothetical protein
LASKASKAISSGAQKPFCGHFLTQTAPTLEVCPGLLLVGGKKKKTIFTRTCLGGYNITNENVLRRYINE